MTTDKLPHVEKGTDSGAKSTGPAVHSSAEQAIKNASIESESSAFRKPKFTSASKSTKVTMIIAGFGAVIVLLLVVVIALGGSKKTSSNNTASPVVLKDLDIDNNSSGYIRSPVANFGAYSLNLGVSQPALIKSASFEEKIGGQITWDDGFAVLVTSIDRDYRPASEYNYKKIAEAGDELVRVNMLVGNASTSTMPIGYSDLAFYASVPAMENTEAERISEDTYSPKDGQTLGSKQTQKVSLHFRVKRGQQFAITKSKTFTQSNAKVKLGEEKNPVLSLKINLI